VTKLDAFILEPGVKIKLRIIGDGDIGNSPARPVNGNNASAVEKVVDELGDGSRLRRAIGQREQVAVGMPRRSLEPEDHMTVVSRKDLKPQNAVRTLIGRRLCDALPAR
jgi:hypothetical protein